MNTPHETIRRAYFEGVEIRLADLGTLHLSGEQPTQELVDAIRLHREAIIEALTEQGIGQPDQLTRNPRRFFVANDCLARSACGELGPCANFMRKIPCGGRKWVPK